MNMHYEVLDLFLTHQTENMSTTSLVQTTRVSTLFHRMFDWSICDEYNHAWAAPRLLGHFLSETARGMGRAVRSDRWADLYDSQMICWKRKTLIRESYSQKQMSKESLPTLQKIVNQKWLKHKSFAD